MGTGAVFCDSFDAGIEGKLEPICELLGFGTFTLSRFTGIFDL